MSALVRIIVTLVPFLLYPLQNTCAEVTLPFEPLELEKEILKSTVKDSTNEEKSPSLKIGKVNLQRILNESEGGKRAKRELERGNDKRKASLLDFRGRVL